MSLNPLPYMEPASGYANLEDEVQHHMQARSLVISKEKLERHDRSFKANMSANARTAAQIVARIRKQELQSIWANTTDQSHTYPGMPFQLGRDLMKKSDLWKILARMPKGCLLHAHLDAMVDIDWLVDQALELPGYHIYAAAPLNPVRGKESVLPTFGYDPGAQDVSDASIWTAAYSSLARVPVKVAAMTFPGGEEAFKVWAMSHMVLPTEEALYHHHGMAPIWKQFGSCFQVIGSLLYTEPIMRRAVRRILHQLNSNGIRYVEFRSTFLGAWHQAGAEKPDSDFSHFFSMFAEELDSYKASHDGSQFWGARIIWSTLRFLNDKDIRQSMLDCIQMKRKFPSIINGFDLVGSEDDGRLLVDMAPLLIWFRKQCEDSGIAEGGLPLFLHAGECLGDGDGPDHNLVDAILLGARRIGHGFSLYKHPLLIDMCKEQKILIESCPISNEILRLTSSIKQHPLSALLSRGVAVSLNNDDPAVLGYGHGQNGLTHEFYHVLLASENFGLEGLGAVVENSIKWAAMEDEGRSVWLREFDMHSPDGMKTQRYLTWRHEWQTWCEWIIEEFVDCL